ncbi:class I SAM-dependent methyltransferase [Paraburkholderia hospita]|uniref:class I SAM-dependent methyltransferase n=1 Tax=Paraburkholderia hospita TaxID=169430 RepID=UPI000B3487C7|nr:class I SAM-dependent methyltransferase [Paraburkholderia hospita]OUL69276.1 SAM-dependent methyltransferase [Paraburkholderia hospita]
MNTRNYDAEAKDHQGHRYAYDFDYLMHEYMLQTFAPFIDKGATLELGCFEGNFTRMLVDSFDDLEVIEASHDCIIAAREKVGAQARFHHSTFETFEATRQYDNIFLIHTLEHLDEPVEVLRRISGWLSDKGRLFVAVPNAHAASRQIAVKMGLIEHETAVTLPEADAGHRITYSSDMLSAHLRKAGLQAIARGGVFFKALANFQIDAALQAGIITKAYMDGCFELGQHYPELCSSIYVICERAAPTLR